MLFNFYSEKHGKNEQSQSLEICNMNISNLIYGSTLILYHIYKLEHIEQNVSYETFFFLRLFVKGLECI